MKQLLMLSILVVLVLSVGIVSAKTQYVLQWGSAIPVDVATISVDVVGSDATIVATANTEDATMGWVWIDASKACVSVVWKANTVTGLPVTVSRQWNADCFMWYFPISALDTLSAELP